MPSEQGELSHEVKQQASWIPLVRKEIGKVIVGQPYLIDRLLLGLLANGHVLLEGVPGLAKTLSVRTLAETLHAKFARVQFTPDLLPADIVGTLVYHPQSAEFQTKHGPIFANLVLADEINRAPAKVQSALLEAMQEHSVTLGEHTHSLPEPFLVLATENPIDQEGTYPLPEAQMDRFMLKLKINYPSRDEERKILDTLSSSISTPPITPIIAPEHILQARSVIDQIYVDEKVKDYIVELVQATRDPESYKLQLKPFILYGASPRATLALMRASRAWAFMRGRAYVTPQDIKDIGMDVLRHRVILSYEAEAENMDVEEIVQKIFDAVPVP